MTTYIATMKTINANGANTITKTFKSENAAESQAEAWMNELQNNGFILTSFALGRWSRENEDIYLGVMEM